MVEHRHGKVDGKAALRDEIHQQKALPALFAPVAEDIQQHALNEQRGDQHAQKLQRIGHYRARRARGPFRPIHRRARLQRRAMERVGYPALAALRHNENAVGIRYTVVAKDVQPCASDRFADQIAIHRRAVAALRGAGVPALGHRRAHGLEQPVVEQRTLFAVVAPVDATVIDIVLVLKRPLGQQVEVIRLVRRAFYPHRQLGLRP